jgi:hypothetical protein
MTTFSLSEATIQASCGPSQSGLTAFSPTTTEKHRGGNEYVINSTGIRPQEVR